MIELVSFDGTALNEFNAFLSPEFSPYATTVRRRPRANRAQVRESQEFDIKTRVIRCWPLEEGLNVTFETFHATVSEIFTPFRGERELVAKWERVTELGTEEIDVRVMVDVVSIDVEQDQTWIDVTVEATDPHWESLTLQSGFDPVGNVDTPPILSVTGGVAITRRRATIRDRTGHGVGSNLVRIPWDEAIAENTLVFVNGLEQPFYKDNGAVWIRVDLPPNGSIPVDLYGGEAIQNDVTADALDRAGIDLDNSTPSELRYETWRVASHPLAATNTWRPGMVIKHSTRRNYTFGLIDSSDEQAQVNLIVRDLTSDLSFDYDDNFDSIVMISDVPMLRLENVELEVFAGRTGGLTYFARAHIHTGFRDEFGWSTIWTTVVFGQSGSGDWKEFNLPEVDLKRANSVAIGLQSLGIRPWSIIIIKGTPTVVLDPFQVPEVTVSNPILAQLRDGLIENETTGDKILLKRRLNDNVPLVVNCVERTLQTESGPEYAQGVDRNNPANWMKFRPNVTNTVTIGGSMALTAEFRDRWEVT